MPKDAYTYMSMVWDDLARDGFHHVTGVANFFSRTGVTSFYRYDFNTKDYGDHPQDTEKVWDDDLVFASFKTFCHEICHTFGMPHCCYYYCIMNGSATTHEASSKPYYLCPVCLRKL